MKTQDPALALALYASTVSTYVATTLKAHNLMPEEALSEIKEHLKKCKLLAGVDPTITQHIRFLDGMLNFRPLQD